MMRVLAFSILARPNLVRSASYLASLFIARNYNLIAYFRISPSGDMRTTPAPSIFLVADLFVWTIHVFFWGLFSFLRVSELCNEIDEDLGFSCNPGLIFYVELVKL